MNFEKSRLSLESLIADNWTTTPIAYDNVSKKGDPDAYIEVMISEGDSSQISLGTGGAHRRVGILVIKIFVPKDTGTKLARQYADTLAALVKSVQIDEITLFSPTLVRIGQVESKYQLNVVTQFWVDNC